MGGRVRRAYKALLAVQGTGCTGAQGVFSEFDSASDA